MNAAQLEPKTNGAHAGSPDGVDLAAVAEGLRRVSLRRLLLTVRPDMPELMQPRIVHVDLDDAVRELVLATIKPVVQALRDQLAPPPAVQFALVRKARIE